MCSVASASSAVVTTAGAEPTVVAVMLVLSEIAKAAMKEGDIREINPLERSDG